MTRNTNEIQTTEFYILNMNEFLDFLLYAFIGYLIARLIMSVITIWLKSKHESLKEELVKIASSYIFVKPEKHGDTIYLFDAHTDQFIAQGKTFTEIKAHCQKRFPDKNVIVSNDYLAQFSELKEMLSEPKA